MRRPENGPPVVTGGPTDMVSEARGYWLYETKFYGTAAALASVPSNLDSGPWRPCSGCHSVTWVPVVKATAVSDRNSDISTCYSRQEHAPRS